MSLRLPFIATDPLSERLRALAEKVAPAPTTLLITGEAGSGKDHFARLIHELSPRRDAPFLKIDCTSLPPTLIESELFGHERGAFTGAIERKLGRLELGGKGTIVLDEIAAFSPEAQGKLLRVLQERTFERLGGTDLLKIEARIIALTGTDLQAAVSAGQFREDLLSGWAVLRSVFPPWGKGPAATPPAAKLFRPPRAPLSPNPARRLPERAARVLPAYSWPGNFRELRNALERAVVFAKSAE